MSELMHVALVTEGPTDRIVIEAAISNLLGDRGYLLRQLHPEESLAFGPLGTGWGGVYHWCRQAVRRSGGALRHDPLFVMYDLLILQLDADVADSRYSEANIVDPLEDLPCAQPCPPPAATTDPLRKVLLRWAGETVIPPRTVLCTPSKSAEAWVLQALFPKDKAVVSGTLECWPNPEARLGQQPVSQRIRKSTRDYRARAKDLREAWPLIERTLSEAKRFSDDFRASIRSP
jgi:hypothetical protein